MNTEMNTEIEELKKENGVLKAALRKLDAKNTLKEKTGKRFIKLIATVFAGKSLKTSIYNSIQEFNEERKISLNTTSNLVASLIRRLTRIGVIALLIALLPTTLMIYQNNLLKIQNKKIQDQTFLAEASRRSAQMFIMGDVLSDINTELDVRGSSILSNTLTGRVVSLSRAMKPYKYIDSRNDELIEKYISPERGQLLITLCKSTINRSFFVDEILQECDFTKSELTNANLIGKVLTEVNLDGSNLSSAELQGVDARRASLRNTNLTNVDLEDANLSFSDLTKADLSGAFLINTNLRKADLTGVKLDSVKVDRKDWLVYIKDKLKLKGATQLFEEYEMDSAYYYKTSKVKNPIILRR